MGNFKVILSSLCLKRAFIVLHFCADLGIRKKFFDFLIFGKSSFLKTFTAGLIT